MLEVVVVIYYYILITYHSVKGRMRLLFDDKVNGPTSTLVPGYKIASVVRNEKSSSD